jgi:nucleotide-binding universal stress UspA family protein
MSIFPTKILLATDGSREADLAATTAAELAESTGSALHVATVVADYPYLSFYYDDRSEEVERLRGEARKVLDGQVDRVQQAGWAVEEAHLRMGGGPAEEIVALAEEVGAGLIVMGSRGLRGVRRALMGSVSDSVVRHAHCPVLVVRGE